MASIQLSNVSLDFPIYSLNARSIKKQLVRVSTGGRVTGQEQNRIIVKALDSISLTFSDGDRVGLVGHNGAGKSTLLRLLAGIYVPTTGSLQVEGNVSALLDVMLGIDHESTGYENILLRGLLYGYSKQQIKAMQGEIAEFTGLGDYLAMPVRTYSSGMLLRLAFSVATSIAPDILVVDEIVGAGDADFMEKAKIRMNELVGRTNILVLASHSDEVIKQFCNKVIKLDAGKVVYYGSLEKYYNPQPVSLA